MKQLLLNLSANVTRFFTTTSKVQQQVEMARIESQLKMYNLFR